MRFKRNEVFSRRQETRRFRRMDGRNLHVTRSGIFIVSCKPQNTTRVVFLNELKL